MKYDKVLPRRPPLGRGLCWEKCPRPSTHTNTLHQDSQLSPSADTFSQDVFTKLLLCIRQKNVLGQKKEHLPTADDYERHSSEPLADFNSIYS